GGKLREDALEPRQGWKRQRLALLRGQCRRGHVRRPPRLFVAPEKAPRARRIVLRFWRGEDPVNNLTDCLTPKSQPISHDAHRNRDCRTVEEMEIVVPWIVVIHPERKPMQCQRLVRMRIAPALVERDNQDLGGARMA